MRCRPVSKAALDLMIQGSIVMAEIESNGIKVDTNYIAKSMKAAAKKIKELETQIRNDKVFATWRKHFGKKTNLASDHQLRYILYNVLGVPIHDRTATYNDEWEGGMPTVNEEALVRVDMPFAKNFLRWKKYNKIVGTFLKGVIDETVDGYLHPFYNLHTTRSFRSSSTKFNFQNIPVRDKELAEHVRRCLVGRWRLLEFDFKGIEVCTMGLLTKDQTLLAYIKDPKKDMHRDMSCECFMLEQGQVSGPIRQTTKNKFVFSEFYGDWYKHCAAYMWDDMDLLDLKLQDGTPLRKHLAKHGISELGACDPEKEAKDGTFEAHIRDVEHSFWNERFVTITNWKRKVWKKFQENGYFDLITGFVVDNLHNKKQVINYKSQGPAFHLNLWCLIQMQAWLAKNRMRSMIVGQIHDSQLYDSHDKEVDDIREKMDVLISRDLPKHFPWITVPMKVEASICPIGGSWWEKKPMEAA